MIFPDILTFILFGFPSGMISLLISALGIAKKFPWVLVPAGLLTIPAMIYLSLASGIPLYLISILQLIGAYYVHKGKPRIAWYLLIPLLLSTLFMTYITVYFLLHPPEMP